MANPILTSTLLTSQIIVILLASITFHEISHALAYYRITGNKPTFKFTWKSIKMESDTDFKELSNTDYGAVLFCGILGGGLIVAILSSTLPTFFFVFTNFIYYYGCKGDLKRLCKMKAFKKEE